jgi:hypothetical protein
LGAAFAGAWGGFLLGIEFNLTVMWTGESSALFWTINVTFCVLAAILGFIFFYHVVILSTSLCGSYLFVRGITLCAGAESYTSELRVVTLLTKGNLGQIDPLIYVCAGIVLVLWGLTAFF